MIKKYIEEKKERKALIKRVKQLPKDYQIVYSEIQKYIFAVATDVVAIDVLTDIVDLFESGESMNKKVLEVTGESASLFTDDLLSAYNM